jgi:hypothetical protein
MESFICFHVLHGAHCIVGFPFSHNVN